MKNQKGQSSVEFALILPILILLVCGIIDLGRILYTVNALTFVCQQTARDASINYSVKDTSTISTYATTQASNLGITLNNADSSIDGGQEVVVTFNTEYKPGDTVNVTIHQSITYITPIIPLMNYFTKPGDPKNNATLKTITVHSSCRVE